MGRLRGLVDVSTGVEHSSANATYKSLCCCEPDPFAVHACDQNCLPANFPSKYFSDFQTFSLLIELGMCGSGHFVCIDLPEVGAKSVLLDREYCDVEGLTDASHYG